MYKTILLPIKTSKSNLDYLFSCNKESAKVWNECVRLSKESWKSNKISVDRKFLQENINGSFSDIILAKAIQIVIKRYLSSVCAINKAIKAGRTDVKYPYKFKNNFNTIWDSNMFRINYSEKYIKLGKPMDKNTGKKQNPILLKFKTHLPPDIIQVELKYDGELILSLTYKDDYTYKQIQSNNICGVDLGEIHAITAIDNNGNNSIITGRLIRSHQRFRNKELGELQKRLSKCQKGSRNYKKYRKAIYKLRNKSDKKIKNDIHNISKKFIDYLYDNEIQTIVIGDLSKFNMNQKNTKSNGNKQRLIQWNHGKLLQKIKEKSERFGVSINQISEAYTSQTCPSCGNKHKPTSRNYVCKCGYKLHRDLVGAINIMSKYIHGGEITQMDITIKPTKYLRIA